MDNKLETEFIGPDGIWRRVLTDAKRLPRVHCVTPTAHGEDRKPLHCWGLRDEEWVEAACYMVYSGLSDAQKHAYAVERIKASLGLENLLDLLTNT